MAGLALKDRFIEFDILRIITICYIIMVRHIDDYASEMYQCQLVLDLTHISLGILVYISGYLLAIMGDTFSSISDIKSFLVKRALRIYPLYALALLVFYMLSIINHHQLLSGLLLYNLFTGEHILTLWYISMIMIYYILFIVINYKSNSLRLWVLAAFIFFLLGIEKITVNKFDGTLILYFPSFICGIVSARYSKYIQLTVKKCIFMLIIFLIVIYFRGLTPSKMGFMIVNIMIISFALPCIFLVSKIKISATMTKFIVNLSYASFCMYLIHRIVFEMALIVYKPRTDGITLLYLYLVAIPIIVILSFYIQKSYDKLVYKY